MIVQCTQLCKHGFEPWVGLHVHVSVPQRYNLIQLWRACCRFVEANLHGLSLLLQKLDVLNRGEGLDSAPFRPQLLRENSGLLPEDYSEFGTWLLNQEKTTYKDLNNYLVQARKRRMARWHVYGAPDDVVIPSQSVLCPWVLFGFVTRFGKEGPECFRVLPCRV